MTKDKALQLMLNGIKVSHDSFSDEEWITYQEDKLLADDGLYDPTEFWKHRDHPSFSKGWHIFNDKLKRG